MHLSDLKNKNIAVWGTAMEGQACLDFLKKHFPEKSVTIIQDNIVPANVDIIFKSPGVSFYLPAVQQALADGIRITSSTDFYLSARQNKPFAIGVTGTKGKSTTSSLIAHMLTALGKKVLLGGNIGKPLIDFFDQDADFVVAEVSSYQGTDLTTPFDLSVLLNLYPEHIDWHQTHEQYYKDKTNLLRIRKGEPAIVNRELESAGFDNVIYFNDRHQFHTDGAFVFDGETELTLPEHALYGAHNLLNLCAALSVIKYLKLDVAKALASLESFIPLPHRLQKIGVKDGITFIDDSIATTPESTQAALDAFKNETVHLIAGGFDRQQDYLELAADILLSGNVKTVIGLPATGTRLLDLLAESPQVVTKQAITMKEAVALAKAQAQKGDLILLSPAAPSYNMYKNFAERGDDFKACALS